MENIVNEPAPKYNYFTAEEYLAEERAALDKHEYYQGEIFAMSGASVNHNKLNFNLTLAFGNKLKGKGCQPYGSDLRIHIPKNTLYTYPDISVFCGDPNLTDNHFDTATNPTLIIEILSKSTRDYDLGGKFKLYRDIESLQAYLVVDSLSMYAELHTKQGNHKWQLQEFNNSNDIIPIDCLQINISIKDIYENISFE
ncbi:MAG: Uma2 family endonuclease [Ferruginibacter sp.]|nr:Uma2 family endonuclease [Ferruginibacter sp.]